jgi:hypothetical protein
MVTVAARVQITAASTAADANTLLFTLPPDLPAKNDSIFFQGSGKEVNMTGALLTVWINPETGPQADPTKVRIRKYDDGYPGVTDAICMVQISYETSAPSVIEGWYNPAEGPMHRYLTAPPTDDIGNDGDIAFVTVV